ncbi:MAG: response regulator [Myxococcales bacterium]|nr:response regulator [Myxococcales bacterium]
MRDTARILIVDDTPDHLSLLGELALRDGFTPVYASSGAEALQVLEREPVAIMLLDLVMPDMDGMAVLAELSRRGLLGALPVVIVTALDDRDARLAALRAGAIDFITKPIDRVEVACKMRSLVELSRLRAESVHGFKRRAADELQARVESAVAGLPLVIYEMQGRDTTEHRGNWLIGDSVAVAGMSRDALLAKASWLAQVHPDDREHAMALLAGALDGTTPRYTHRFRLKVAGEYRWRLNAASLCPETGCLRGALLNIDEQVQLEDQLRHTQKMEAIGKLAGGVAHDFNNVLAIILAYVGFVRDALPPGDPRREDLEQVARAADRGTGLATQLLTFARQQPVLRQPTDLNVALAGVERLLVGALGSGIDLTMCLSATPMIVEIDRVQFDQVLLNLAVNARDAMPTGGCLSIALEQFNERWIQLRVTDTGVGMDAHTRERVFEPFFTTKAVGKGTGLGLATSFGIVKAAGGSFRVESAPGQGASFVVELPVAAGPADAAPPADPAAVDAARARGAVRVGRSVLIVEDEHELRTVMRRVLEGAGYEVHVAANGLDAIAKLDALAPVLSAVISDVRMPGCNGYVVAEHAAKVAPRAAILLTSGFVDGLEQRTGVPILWKPVPPARLLQAVAEAIVARRTSLPPFTVAASASRPPAVPPRAVQRSLAPETRSPGPAQPRRDRLLVVDDDEAIALAHQRALTHSGFDVTVVGSLARARHALSEGDLDGLVIDAALPDGSGFDLIGELRGARSEIPVVMLTSAPSVESASRAVRSRVSDYLPKPFPSEELVTVVRAAVETGRIARLRSKLLAARFGGDELVGDIAATARSFAEALTRIQILFQPIVRAADGTVFGYEALLRSDQPGFGAPLRLLAAAEVLGRVDDLGLAVRGCVALTMRAHVHRTEAIFVNLHPSELRAELLTAVTEPLGEHAARVVLEVTERASLDVGPRLVDELAQIREFGFRVAVDDLGEGYAGLASLVHLRPDIAKIDMSLVRDIDRAPLKQDIVAALVDMAKRSGILVVAEGVETKGEARLLTQLGCDLLQGYLYARPGPAFPPGGLLRVP